MSEPSWVIWMKDGRWAIAFGATAEHARINFMKEWSQGIDRVESARDYPSALPVRLQLVQPRPPVETPAPPLPRGRVLPEEMFHDQ